MPTTTTPEVVSIEEARDYLGYGDDRDSYVESLVIAARDYCEKHANRTFRELAVRSLLLSCWPKSRMVRMEYPPLIDINSVKYFDTDAAEQTVTSTNYRTHIRDGHVGWLEFDIDYSYPTLQSRAFPITISYDSGYTTLASIPESAKLAMMLILRWLDGDEMERNPTKERADALLAETEWGSYV